MSDAKLRCQGCNGVVKEQDPVYCEPDFDLCEKALAAEREKVRKLREALSAVMGNTNDTNDAWHIASDALDETKEGRP